MISEDIMHVKIEISNNNVNSLLQTNGMLSQLNHPTSTHIYIFMKWMEKKLPQLA